MSDPTPTIRPPGHRFGRRDALRWAGATAGAVAAAPALAGCTDDVPDPSAPRTGVDGVEPLELGELTPGVQYPEGYVGPKARTITPFRRRVGDLQGRGPSGRRGRR